MKLELKDFVGPLITGAALTFGVIQYQFTSYDEFVKPVRDAELQVYKDTADIAGQIATLPKGSPEQEKLHRDFLRLYYGPLTMLQDFAHGRSEDSKETARTQDMKETARCEDPNEKIPTVEEAATAFKTCLERQDCRDDLDSVRRLSQALAYTCRESLRKSWRYSVTEFNCEYKKTIHNYEKRFQK